jgi:hypothetical protein
LVNATIDTNNATSPEGLQNATLLTEETNTGNHAIREASNILIAADDSQYVVSFYAKSNGRNVRFIDDGYAGSNTIVNFNLSSGGTFSNGSSVIDSDAVAFGDGWYYCYAVIDKASAAQSAFRFSLRLLGGASNDNDSYTGDGSRGVWLYGKQVEDSVTYPTSYIPNHSGGSVTRSADSCSGAGTSSTFNDSEGVLYAEIAAIADDQTSKVISLSDGTFDERVLIATYSGGSNQIRVFIKSGGSFSATITTTLTDITEFNKIAYRYKSGETKLFINGSLIGTSADTFSITGLNVLQFASGTPTATPFYGNAKQVIVFNTALSNTDCEILTGTSYESFAAMATALNYTTYE